MAMVQDSEEQVVELRGVLESVSARFWSGWGFATLQSEDGRLVKITGTLEGHVAGSSVLVRGVYVESRYGRQLDCSSIAVDSVSGELAVIRGWARRSVKGLEHDVVTRMRRIAIKDRWAVLSSEALLIDAGFACDDAKKIAEAARGYLLFIEAKRGLMERGFTDKESAALWTRYDESVLQVVDQDPYLPVLEGVLGFARVDVVLGGPFPRTHERRLHAAQVAAVLSVQRLGHTATLPSAMVKEAAQLAGVYTDAVERSGRPTRYVARFDHYVQLKSTAHAEADIAAWIGEATRRQ